MIYIAAPFSSPIPEMEEQRFLAVREFTDRLLDAGLVAFCPVVYLRSVTQRRRLKADAGTWMAFNMSMLRRADALFLLELPGWETSKGVTVELNVCKMLNIPVNRYDKNMNLRVQAGEQLDG